MVATLTASIARKMPRQDRSRALVDAIIEAATQILVQQGRDALTTNAVALRAGVSVGSLYQYFPNRQAILAAVAIDHLDSVHHCVENVELRDAYSLAEATKRIVAGLFRAHRINPALHLALAREIEAGELSSSLCSRPDAKVAVIALFGSVAPVARDKILCRDINLAVSVAAEIAHALAHAAIDHSSDDLMFARLEREAVNVLLAYLHQSK
jgi:AcrR family transcriptional regulator